MLTEAQQKALERVSQIEKIAKDPHGQILELSDLENKHYEENTNEHKELSQGIKELSDGLEDVDNKLTIIKSEVGEKIVNTEDTVKREISDLKEQIHDIQFIPGEKGDKGDKGDKGEKGKDGIDGKDGETIVGEKGDKGDKPDHKWEGTKLAFEKPDGTFGKYVDLKGFDGVATYYGGGGGKSIRVSNDGVLFSEQVKTINFADGLKVSGDMDSITVDYDGSEVPETDPIFTAWLDTNPLADFLTQSQTDLLYYPLSDNPAGYLTSETDPVFSQWLIDTPPAYQSQLSNYLFLPGSPAGQTVVGAVNIVGITDMPQFMVIPKSITTGGQASPTAMIMGRYGQPLLTVLSQPELFLFGDAPSISGLNNPLLLSSKSVDMPFNAFAGANESTGTLANINIGLTNNLSVAHPTDLTSPPTNATILGRTGGNFADPNFALIGANAGYLFSTGGNMHIGSFGMTSTDGNVYIATQDRNTKDSIKLAVLYDGHVVIGGYTNTIASAKLEVQGDAYFQNAVGIGTAPDPINFNFSVKSPLTVGISLEAGTGYNLLYYRRAGVAYAYMGMGSLTTNGFSVLTYANLQSPISFGSSSVVQFYLDHNTNGSHIYSQYSGSGLLFSIGLDPANYATEPPTAKLYIRDARDTSSPRTIQKLKFSNAQNNTSRYIECLDNTNGVKALINNNGVYAQKEVTTTVSSVNNAAVLFMTFTLNSFRSYYIEAEMIALQAGGTSKNAHIKIKGFFEKRTTANPTQIGDSEFEVQTDNDALNLPYFVINGATVEVWIQGITGQTWNYNGWGFYKNNR